MNKKTCRMTNVQSRSLSHNLSGWLSFDRVQFDRD